MKMTYKQFEDILLHDDYSIREIRHLFNAVKAMSGKARMRVIRWVLFGEISSEAVEELSAEELIDTFGFKPINAFVVLDWLETAPEEAKYFLTKHHASYVPDEEVVQEMRDFLRSHNVEAKPTLNCEETGDVVEDPPE